MTTDSNPRYPSMNARLVKNKNSTDIMLTIANVGYCLTRDEARHLASGLNHMVQKSLEKDIDNGKS